MNKINTKRVLLGIFITVIPIITITSSVYLFFKSREEVKGISNEQRYAPYFTNLPPSSISINEEYIFKPKVFVYNDEEYELVLLDKPSWIYIDNNDYVRGYPDSIGTYKFVFKLDDGYNTSTVIQYLLVTDDE